MLNKNSFLKISELLRGYLEGDETACGELLGCPYYQQQVKRIAHKYTKGTFIAWEDAVQTAHEKVFLALKQKKFKSEKGEFSPWAITVAKFAIIDFIRQEKSKTCLSIEQHLSEDCILSDTIADQFDPLNTVERAELILKVRQAVKALAQSYPERKYLKLWQGKVQEKTQTQLAEDLGISQSAVSKRWKELTARIAEVLE